MSPLCSMSLSSSQIVGTFDVGFVLFSYKDTIYIMDQHAAHERIRLDNLVNVFKNPLLIKDAPNHHHLLQLSRLDLDLLNDLSKERSLNKVLPALKSRACRGAMTIRDVTNDQGNLLKFLSQSKFPFICAHGRPTVVELITAACSEDP